MKANYPSTRALIAAANRRAHCPHTIPDQSERGVDALAKANGTVVDAGMLTRDKPLPSEQSSPLTGSVGCPYERPADA